MQNKIIKLLVTFMLLFSLQGFSQTAEKSAHPLLDKYYPRAQIDTNKAITTQIKPVPETKPASALTTVAAPPAVTSVATPPADTTVAAPPVVTTPPADTTATTTAITTTAVPGVTTAPVTTTTTTINKLATVTPRAPVQKIQGQPATPSPLENRLGSSTKQYDTWEKNNNGAGSVTTSPK